MNEFKDMVIHTKPFLEDYAIAVWDELRHLGYKPIQPLPSDLNFRCIIATKEGEIYTSETVFPLLDPVEYWYDDSMGLGVFNCVGSLADIKQGRIDELQYEINRLKSSPPLFKSELKRKV